MISTNPNQNDRQRPLLQYAARTEAMKTRHTMVRRRSITASWSVTVDIHKATIAVAINSDLILNLGMNDNLTLNFTLPK
jgi:hypothetical protein